MSVALDSAVIDAKNAAADAREAVKASLVKEVGTIIGRVGITYTQVRRIAAVLDVNLALMKSQNRLGFLSKLRGLSDTDIKALNLVCFNDNPSSPENRYVVNGRVVNFHYFDVPARRGGSGRCMVAYTTSGNLDEFRGGMDADDTVRFTASYCAPADMKKFSKRRGRYHALRRLMSDEAQTVSVTTFEGAGFYWQVVRLLRVYATFSKPNWAI